MECYIWDICMEYRVSHLYMVFLTFYVEYTWAMYGICIDIYIYMWNMYEMLYGINGVSHFYGIHMEYVWNMCVCTYIRNM